MRSGWPLAAHFSHQNARRSAATDMAPALAVDAIQEPHEPGFDRQHLYLGRERGSREPDRACVVESAVMPGVAHDPSAAKHPGSRVPLVPSGSSEHLSGNEMTAHQSAITRRPLIVLEHAKFREEAGGWG